MSDAGSVRPTKKQRELLEFIGEFIETHGYSPSYREIMAGLQYTSVATVSLHVNSLIRRGHLRKRDRSARSLELTTSIGDKTLPEQWLLDQVSQHFASAESSPQPPLSQLESLVDTLTILQCTAAPEYTARLQRLIAKNTTSSVSET